MRSRYSSEMGDSSDSSSGTPEGFRLFFEAALSEHGGACHFGPLTSLPWPLGHVRLIGSLDSV